MAPPAAIVTGMAASMPTPAATSSAWNWIMSGCGSGGATGSGAGLNVPGCSSSTGTQMSYVLGRTWQGRPSAKNGMGVTACLQ